MNLIRSWRRRIHDESGFSLTELLVVILVIGILAGIAVPQFISQREKASDADAKSDARNLVSLVASCVASHSDPANCDGQGSGDDLQPGGLELGSDPGQVHVSGMGAGWFQVTAVSKVETEGNPHTYTIRNDGDGPLRSCSAGPGNDKGGCNNGTW